MVLTGVTVRREGGVVMVDDGFDIWLAEAVEYDAVRRWLELVPPAEGVDPYQALCSCLNSVATMRGTSRGGWRRIVDAAVMLGLLDELAASFLPAPS